MNVVIAENHSDKVLYVIAKTNKTLPDNTLVEKAGFCLLRMVGIKAMMNTMVPIDITVSCQ